MLLRAHNVHNCAHKSLPKYCTLSHLHPVHILTPYVSKIHFNIILQSVPDYGKWYLYLRFSD